MLCQGQLLPISENDTLFQLIGTTYGGDGQSTFALPDLQSRIPVHQGQGSGLSNRSLAETGGTESVTLTVQQIPVHAHPLLATSAVGTKPGPGGNFYSASGVQLYADANVATVVPMKNTIVGATGGSQPHENMAPYLGLNFIISLFGLFPSQT
jgi:microcystin-dependent protein